MPRYNFDVCPDRRKSDAMKYCALDELYGRHDLTPLWIADMDFEVAPEITEALSQRFRHNVYGYASVPEDFFPSITGWLLNRHGFEVEREEITFVPGVVKAIGYMVNRLTREGDKVLIQPPVYPPFRRVVEGNGRVAVVNPLVCSADGYRMDLDALRETVRTERPAMMILCNPHNPIGLQWDEPTLRRVADICDEYGVTVVSDEIHGDLMLGGRHHIPYLSVSDAARRTGVMLGAPSKTFNIPGVVSSWMVIKDEALRRRVFPWMEVNEFSAPTFTATTATVAAYHHGEPWLDEALEYIAENIKYVSRRIEDETAGIIRVYRPEASFLLWLDCRGLGLGHDELNRLFVERAHVAMNDGASFGEEGVGFMRMNVAAPRSVLDRAVDSIVASVNSIKKPALNTY